MEAGQSVSGAIVSGGANTGSRCDIGNCGALPLANPDPVAYSIMPMNSGKDYKARETDVSQPLMAAGPVSGAQGGDYITEQNPDPVIMQPRYARNGRGAPDVVSSPLDAEGGATSDKRQIVAAGSFWDGGRRAFDIQTNGSYGAGAVSHTLAARDFKAATDIVAESNKQPTVRRLTPVECLRLQGFPDDWFEGVPGYSDTKAYRAIGNSVAIPCVEWIFQRVLEFDEAQE